MPGVLSARSLIKRIHKSLVFFNRETIAAQRKARVEALFAYFLLFSIGFSYLYNFVMHTFFGELAAGFIGWQDSPFQAEVGFASLGFAVVGFPRSAWLAASAHSRARWQTQAAQ